MSNNISLINIKDLRTAIELICSPYFKAMQDTGGANTAAWAVARKFDPVSLIDEALKRGVHIEDLTISTADEDGLPVKATKVWADYLTIKNLLAKKEDPK